MTTVMNVKTSDINPIYSILCPPTQPECNCAIIQTQSGVKACVYRIFASDIPLDYVMTSSLISPDESQCEITPITIPTNQELPAINISPKYHQSLIGFPVYPNIDLYFSYRGKLKRCSHNATEPGFITSNTVLTRRTTLAPKEHTA